jgi:hypothetical protein
MLVLANSTQVYFREALVFAMRTSNITVTESAQVYVVHLLNEFSRSEKAFAGADHGENITIIEMLERAGLSDDYEALRIYRHLGDTSLYNLGFFKEAHAKRIVSLTYYKDMGAQAYSHASLLSRPYAINSAALFQELSERFDDILKVVENIAHYQGHSKDI